MLPVEESSIKRYSDADDRGIKMHQIQIENLTFKYPGREEPALKDISLTLEEGEVLCICGETGCGKTTLLRNLKPAICPHGERSGRILVSEEDIGSMELRQQTAKIGFVMQDPENQIVTDRVWHELAFGLENLGMDPEKIRLRVAETAGFFGIEGWYEKSTSSLSGGQKQILSLASVMVTDPEILVLDEPVSRLDPVSAGDFISALRKVNKELGTTVVIAEHRLEDILDWADKLGVMKRGEMTASGPVREIVGCMTETGSSMTEALPQITRAYASAGTDSEKVRDTVGDDEKIEGDPADGADSGKGWSADRVPLNVTEGRAWIRSEIERSGNIDTERSVKAICDIENQVKTDSDIVNHEEENIKGTGEEGVYEMTSKSAAGKKKNEQIILKNIWFRYVREADDVVRDLSFRIEGGSVVALVGGNGAGKSTLLSLMAGTNRPYRGKVKVRGSVSKLPQEPSLLFTEDTVGADLESKGSLTEYIEAFGLESLMGRHPYDLSGGEKQRLALCEVFSTGADILLLDEPTKGLDGEFRERLRSEIEKKKSEGKTVVIVSHDMEFCCRTADRCIMMFGGRIAADARTRDFFSGNSFYTTQVNRAAGRMIPGAVLPEDIADTLHGGRG